MSRQLSGMISLIWIATTVVALADDWPQWRGPQRDGEWRETGIVSRFSSDQLPLRWRVPVGSGYSGPTVAKGRVYVTDRLLDPQRERVLCFDMETGKELWKLTYDCVYKGIGYQAGPRASVSIEDGRAYALGAMGHFHCLDAVRGTVIWKKDLNAEFSIDMPIWGISASPLIYEDRILLQIGGEKACVVALQKSSGETLWTALSDDRASYSAPIMVQQAGVDVALFWTGDSVAGLNPIDGKVYWRFPFAPKNMPIGIATPVVSQNDVFVTSFYDGSLMLRLQQDRPNATRVWQKKGRDERNTEALHSIISTPVFLGQHIYGVCSYGELRCLDAKTGERLWEDLTATPKARWSTIHFVRHGKQTWMFNERGELIIGELAPSGFREISRTRLLDPTLEQLRQRKGVCWSHPAFANRHVFARNDKEMVCASLAAAE